MAAACLARRDGKELFYETADSKLMSVEVSTTGSVFKPGIPKLLFEAPIFGGLSAPAGKYWDVSPDGKRFLINTVSEQNAAPITVVLNWAAMLKR